MKDLSSRWSNGPRRSAVGRMSAGTAALLLIAGALIGPIGSQAVLAASPEIASISAGVLHTCAVTNDGAAWCWGHNGHGQLGDGSTSNSSSPVRVRQGSGFLTDVRAISAGRFHSCAVKTDGSAWCWGDDAYGQLGDGTTGNADGLRLTPVKVLSGKKALAGATAVSAGLHHSCARTNVGSAWCWGSNEWGQIGDGTMVVPRLTATQVRQGKRNLGGVATISAGGHHTCVTTSDAAAWCWGLDRFGQLGDGTTGDTGEVRLQPVRVIQGGGNLNGVTAIGAGLVHTCALTAGGDAWCWGRGDSGQIGDGELNDRLKAVRVRDDDGSPFGNADDIESGAAHSCAVKANGSAWCWGESTGGKLGDGSPINVSAVQPHPVRVITGNGPLDDVRSVSAGSEHSCAVSRSDVAWCWGTNPPGRLGDGTIQNSPVAVRVQF